MSVAEKSDELIAKQSASKAWLRALELTAPIARNRVLFTAIERMAERMGDAPALLSDRESFSYSTLVARANQHARWALAQDLRKGDVVCLMMPNRPEYFAIWLGLTSVGVVVSLLNTNLIGPSLAHSINVASAKAIIAAQELSDAVIAAQPELTNSPRVWMHGGEPVGDVRALHIEIEQFSGSTLERGEDGRPAVDDLALYIYTSGTTGLPKAAKVSHARTLQWSYWFAGMMDVTSIDRMYNCLPMYHSVGGVQAIGAMLVAGGSVVVREKFSASQFWSDVTRWDCTIIQYIGELCRYLLHTDKNVNESEHRVRLACGNGMAPEVWIPFKERFRIPQVLEFYAATEGSVSLFNAQGKVGAIGHIPAYLTHRFSPALISIDAETGEPARNESGFCVSAPVNEPGEALGRMNNEAAAIGSRFDGYTSQEASSKKILRNVFEQGDAWFRTGDLMRRDEKGFYYFIDRIGDTFRRKGENVSTSEVAEVLSACPRVQHANVYGVRVPSVEGRVGMAMIVPDAGFSLAECHRQLVLRLPAYARPVFLRMRTQAELTGTFKYSKTELVREGYDPDQCKEPVYFDRDGEFALLDREGFARIQSGEIRI